MHDLAQLHNIEFLQGLSEHHLEKLALLGEVKQYDSGKILFRENDIHPFFHVVIEGLVALDIWQPRRAPKRILTIGPGEILAWSAVLAGGQMTTSATTLSSTQLFTWPAEKFQALCQSDHEIGFVVMQRIARAVSRRLTAPRLQLLDMLAETEPVLRAGP